MAQVLRLAPGRVEVVQDRQVRPLAAHVAGRRHQVVVLQVDLVAVGGDDLVSHLLVDTQVVLPRRHPPDPRRLVRLGPQAVHREPQQPVGDVVVVRLVALARVHQAQPIRRAGSLDLEWFTRVVGGDRTVVV